MTDYQLIIKVRNARLWRAIQARGYKLVSAFCRDHNLHQMQVSELLSMKKSPLRKDGEWSKAAMDVSSAVRVDPETLWPEHMRRKLAATSWTVNVDSSEAISTTVEPISIAQTDKKRLLAAAIGGLSPRAKEVIEKRFYHNMTYEEVGKEEGVTRERIRQIEMKAIQSMRRTLQRNGAADDLIDSIKTSYDPPSL